MKGYTNRDRGQDMSDVDLREGLDATIVLFAGRFRERGVALEREPMSRCRASARIPATSIRPGRTSSTTRSTR